MSLGTRISQGFSVCLRWAGGGVSCVKQGITGCMSSAMLRIAIILSLLM